MEICHTMWKTDKRMNLVHCRVKRAPKIVHVRLGWNIFHFKRYRSLVCMPGIAWVSKHTQMSEDDPCSGSTYISSRQQYNSSTWQPTHTHPYTHSHTHAHIYAHTRTHTHTHITHKKYLYALCSPYRVLWNYKMMLSKIPNNNLCFYQSE